MTWLIWVEIKLGGSYGVLVCINDEDGEMKRRFAEMYLNFILASKHRKDFVLQVSYRRQELCLKETRWLL
ncbi:hypothetical protein Prudu_009810 [Prunus dulcis]|uniref:Uncharacterized protein n=1 Tax=Prunus dulcis TaxID=3755 RepID=A0A4Y1R7T8_PRUDU|nr:hypothetical protein Prudu_009810 [Prunus dulcis]